MNKIELKNLVAENKLDEVFSQILNNNNLEAEIHNDIIILNSRYDKVNREDLRDTISSEEKNLELNKIKKSLLTYIDEIEVGEKDELESPIEDNKQKDAIAWLRNNLKLIQYSLTENIFFDAGSKKKKEELLTSESVIYKYTKIKVSEEGLFRFSVNERHFDHREQIDFKRREYIIPLDKIVDSKLDKINLDDKEYSELLKLSTKRVFEPDHCFRISLFSYNSEKAFITRVYSTEDDKKYVDTKSTIAEIYLPNLEIAERIEKCLIFLSKSFGAKEEMF